MPNEPGGTRHFELGCGAARAGYQVTVIASDISYITGASTSGDTEPTLELPDSLTVVRARTGRTIHGTFIGRLFSLVSFAASSFIKSLRIRRVDVVMGTSPPIFQALSAGLVAALRRRPFLLEIRDLWPEFIIDMGLLKNPFLIRCSRWLEGLLYARATHLLVNSPAYVDYLIQKNIPQDKITLLPNGVDPAMFDPSSDGSGVRKKLSLNGKFVVVYAGAVGPANDLDLLLEAAARLKSNSVIHILIVGDGKERKRLQAQAEIQSLDNVSFAGPQPKHEMRNFLACADACVAILKNIGMFRMTYPNKVFDYMAAGRPIVVAIDGVIREVVETARAGIFSKPGDPASLADAICFLAGHQKESEAMSRNGRLFVERHFNRNTQTKQFISLLQKMTSG
jgi:glycosyltransferase involved in cell wall biosynthesis